MALTGHIIQTTSFMLHISERLMFSVCNLMLYRRDKSSGVKNASASPQRSLLDRSRKRYVEEQDPESDTLPDSASSNRRQSQSTHEVLGRSGQTKNVSLTALTPQINKPGSKCVYV
jgi:hypothetical protein